MLLHQTHRFVYFSFYYTREFTGNRLYWKWLNRHYHIKLVDWGYHDADIFEPGGIISEVKRKNTEERNSNLHPYSSIRLHLLEVEFLILYWSDYQFVFLQNLFLVFYADIKRLIFGLSIVYGLGIHDIMIASSFGCQVRELYIHVKPVDSFIQYVQKQQQGKKMKPCRGPNTNGWVMFSFS